MNCDHSAITDIVVVNKFVLIYCGDRLMAGCLVTGEVKSAHTVEVFDTVQELIDRGIDLGFQCCVEYMIQSMECGAVLPSDVMAMLHSTVWDDDIGFQGRMIALGYSRP